MPSEPRNDRDLLPQIALGLLLLATVFAVLLTLAGPASAHMQALGEDTGTASIPGIAGDPSR